MKARITNLSITFGEYANQVIQQNCQRFVEQEKEVLKDEDPEPLHQMRVGMRRLSTALSVFSPAIVLPKAASSQSIRKIAKDLGSTRDLDVLQMELETRYLPCLKGKERSNFDLVLDHLKQQRDESFIHLKKTLKSDRYRELKQAIQAWLDQPTYAAMADLPILQILPDLLLPLLCQMWLHPGWLVGTTIQLGQVTLLINDQPESVKQQLEEFGDILHSLRKQMKGVRYQAEFFEDFYSDTYTSYIQEFKTIQDILGQLQDNAVLRQFLATVLDADLEQVLPTVAQQIQQLQMETWQAWQPLQQRYLAAEFRQSLRSLVTTPLTEKTKPPQSRQRRTKHIQKD